MLINLLLRYKRIKRCQINNICLKYIKIKHTLNRYVIVMMHIQKHFFSEKTWLLNKKYL